MSARNDSAHDSKRTYGLVAAFDTPEALLEACNFVVVTRPGSSFDELREALTEKFHDRIVDARGGEQLPEETDGLSIYLSDAVYFALSSTELRQRVRAGRGIRYRVTPEVERYVQSHGLYREAVAEAAS